MKPEVSCSPGDRQFRIQMLSKVAEELETIGVVAESNNTGTRLVIRLYGGMGVGQSCVELFICGMNLLLVHLSSSAAKSHPDKLKEIVDYLSSRWCLLQRIAGADSNDHETILHCRMK